MCNQYFVDLDEILLKVAWSIVIKILKREMKKMEIKSHTFNHLGGALSGTK